MSSSRDFDCGSKLLQIPYDVRREIYTHLVPLSVHIHIEASRRRLSPCVSSPVIPRTSPGWERREGLPTENADWDFDHIALWATRLQSSWGEHWKCEEVASRIGGGDDSNLEVLMRTCKKIRGEISDYISRSTEVIVADLTITDQLLRQPPSAVAGGFVFADVRQLRIISRLPTGVLTVIEEESIPDEAEDFQMACLSSGEAAQATAWLRLSATLSGLAYLRKLRIWLDDSEAISWNNVNERAILVSLESLAHKPALDVCMELPRHIDDYKTTPAIRIQRRIRQRHFGYKDFHARLQVASKADFPVLEAGLPPFENVSQVKLEVIERGLWDEGIDVEEECIDRRLLDDGIWICKEDVWSEFPYHEDDITPHRASGANLNMALIHIAGLDPELADRDSKQFKAAVTLIWPYSSSQREFALLLAEPEFRLRRKKGQVRARFTGSSAKALATTGVGIGDVVVLGVRGAHFVQEGTVSTPGRSIDWELEYAQTVVVQVFRDGTEIANLDLVDAAPTPAPRSPVRRVPVAAPSPAQQWSSPAFLKRARLSDGSVFAAPYDPLADENAEGHDKKRRRKSYRDWKAWTYSARTPSPEKEDIGMEEDLDPMDASPSHPTQLPHTPVSPSKPDALSVVAGPMEHAQTTEEVELKEEQATAAAVGDAAIAGNIDNKAAHSLDVDDFVRDDDYYDLYAGPDEVPSADVQYAFGGDTEANTEDEDGAQDDTMEDNIEGASFSATEVNTENPEDDQDQAAEEARVETAAHAALGEQEVEASAGSAPGEDVLVEVTPIPGATDTTVEGRSTRLMESAEEDFGPRLENAPIPVMPPPILPSLDTNILAPDVLGMLTPVGKEPASPTLQPLDSALLPLPSPFPGGRDTDLTSYFDHASSNQGIEIPEALEEEQLPSEASYIMENSFFSSISSSKNLALHPDHESAFTPVRFTFGMDGAGFSRPLELSSPALTAMKHDETIQHGADILAEEFEPEMLSPDGAGVSTIPESMMIDPVSSPPQQHPRAAERPIPEVIELSSDSEEESDEDATENADEVEEEYVHDDEPVRMSDFDHFDADDDADEDAGNAEVTEQEKSAPASKSDHSDDDVPEHGMPTSTNRSPAASEVVDLGSPSGSSEVEDFAPGVEDESVVERSAKDQDLHSEHLDKTPAKPTEVESHSESTAMDYAPVISTSVRSAQGEATTHTPTPQKYEDVRDASEDEAPLDVSFESLICVDDSDVRMQDTFTVQASFDAQGTLEQVEELHPDVKMESIEEGSGISAGELDMQEGGQVMGPSAEILIEVPDDGHKLGETHTIAVPATGPARNTRSKTKPSMSPTREEFPVLKRVIRPSRSKAYATPAHPAISPPRTRTRSTMSPSQDAAHTSSYSLRSQSKLLSPTKSTSVTASATNRNSRGSVGHSQRDELDLFLTSFEPSQDLNASQGRYSDVPFVKDSEEESLHSEHSISTVKFSDDWHTFTAFSDPVMPNGDATDDVNLKLPPSTAPEPAARMGARARWNKTQAQVNQRRSSPTQPPLSSPRRARRSAGSAEAAPPSPRTTRTTSRHVRNVLLTSPPTTELVDEATPKGSQDSMADVSYTELPGESEGKDLRSSPPAPMDVDERLHSSPPVEAPSFPSIKQQSGMDSNRTMTPEATQQTTMDSQSSLTASQQQALPITPQLTQDTLRGLRSLTASIQNDSTAIEASPKAKTSPNVVTRSTPRRNATQTDVASPSTSPIEHSPDVSSDAETTLVPQSTGPSVGLSTPLAYYTPLNALPFFLNRSSQFHTASNPDVLALVTSGTTPAQRSAKGRKDWTTTLHISDASTWPATTTVNIFRAYETALPIADTGDIILLRAMAVKSLNRHPSLISADESSWCVWRYKQPVWSKKKSAFGDVKAREEVKGPAVERGEGEWGEVERVRKWYLEGVRAELEAREEGVRVTRSRDKEVVMEDVDMDTASQRVTRSRDKGKEKSEG
ncbi:hypothetical protein CC86DRAFT_455561, partial [Ophiobolus disseminans]